jgi:ubiquitin carboxyl-terminal hydrolase 9/24
LLKSLFVNPTIIQYACGYLSAFHKTGKWRTRRVDDWVITLQDKMKSPTGYVGIKNLGCICYMNSFIQQLFMIPYFRHAITATEDPCFSPAPEDIEDNLLFQIQKMFLNLQHSEKKFYNPKDLCHAIKDYEGNPTNVAEQMDIDEFSGILFDRLENQLKQTKQTKQETLIKDMFGGVFSNEIVCKGCPHFS